jgi:hypothetical protein
VRFAFRHPVSLVIVLAACAALTGVFTFARPEYHREYESKPIDFSNVHHYSAASVRQAFADHGIQLRRVNRFAGIGILSTRRLPLDADQLQVMVGPRTGTGSWGPRLEPYDERFGNVMVTYGGRDEELLERVEAAVDSFR